MAKKHDEKWALANEESGMQDTRGSFLEKRSGVLEDAEDASFNGLSGFGGIESQERWAERDARNALRHVDNLLNEVTPAATQDVASGSGSQVEYQRVRLERVMLVGVYSAAETTLAAAEESMRELAALAQTAGAVVCDGVLQQRDHPDAASYLGSGKARELARLVAAENADTIIADTELPPSQRRALEDIAGVKVIDRTAVILDIFARHATSKEGKAQVELAQLEYMLPRLRGWGAALSRQAGGQAAGQNGGIGSRGPGET
ncbi:MAG: GTPase HflX, partial [Bifidobacteriaceae bacterium]|nr:GTPase HflX [Bifidobacteriaceae bacterium]